MNKPIPFKENPGIADVRMNNLFRWLREHSAWQQQQNGVTWDMRCEMCGRTVENAKINGMTIVQGEGYKIMQRITQDRDYNPVLCTVCAPY